MQIRLVNFLIAILLSALIAYGLWSTGSPLKEYIGIGSFLFLSGTLIPAMGIEYEYARRATNVKTSSGLFFVIGLVVNIGCAYINISAITYILTSAIIYLIFVLMANTIYNLKQ